MNRLQTRVGKAMLFTAMLSVCLLPPAPALAGPRKAPAKVVGYVSSADGVRIAYDVQGTGDVALIFVHGWLSDRSDWNGVARLLAANHMVVTLDLAGHGASGGRKADQLDVERFGQDVSAVASTVGPRRIILIGHNLGGDAIVEAAMSLRGQVAGLIWVDSYRNLDMLPASAQTDEFVKELTDAYPETTRAVARRMFSDSAKAATIDQKAAKMSATPRDVAIPSVRKGLAYSHQVRARLETLKLKVIAYTPESATASEVEMMRRKYGVHLQRLRPPREGSFIMLEDPKRFSSLLGEAIGKILR